MDMDLAVLQALMGGGLGRAKWDGSKGASYRKFANAIMPKLVTAYNDTDKSSNRGVRCNIGEFIIILKSGIEVDSQAHVFLEGIQRAMKYDKVAVNAGFLPSPLLNEETLRVMVEFSPGRTAAELRAIYAECVKGKIPSDECFALVETFHPDADAGSVVYLEACMLMNHYHHIRQPKYDDGHLDDMHGYPDQTAAFLHRSIHRQPDGSYSTNSHSRTRIPLLDAQIVLDQELDSYSRHMILAAKLMGIMDTVFERVDPGHEVHVVQDWVQREGENLEAYMSRCSTTYLFVKSERLLEPAAVIGMIRGLRDATLKEDLLKDSGDPTKALKLQSYSAARAYISAMRSQHEKTRANLYALDVYRADGVNSLDQVGHLYSGDSYQPAQSSRPSTSSTVKAPPRISKSSSLQPAESGDSSTSQRSRLAPGDRPNNLCRLHPNGIHANKDCRTQRKSVAASSSTNSSRVMATEIAGEEASAGSNSNSMLLTDLMQQLRQDLKAEAAAAFYRAYPAQQDAGRQYGGRNDSCAHCNNRRGHPPQDCFVLHPEKAFPHWKPPPLNQLQYKAYVEACRRAFPGYPDPMPGSGPPALQMAAAPSFNQRPPPAQYVPPRQPQGQHRALPPAAPPLAVHQIGYWDQQQQPAAPLPLPAPPPYPDDYHCYVVSHAATSQFTVAAETRQTARAERAPIAAASAHPHNPVASAAAADRSRRMPASFIVPDQTQIQPGGLHRPGGGARFELPPIQAGKSATSSTAEMVTVQVSTTIDIPAPLWKQVLARAPAHVQTVSRVNPTPSQPQPVYTTNMVEVDLNTMRWRDPAAPQRRAEMEGTRATLDRFDQTGTADGRGGFSILHKGSTHHPQTVHLDSGAELSLTFEAEMERQQLPWVRYLPGEGPHITSAGGDSLRVVGRTLPLLVCLNKGMPTQIKMVLRFQVLNGEPFSFTYLLSKDFIRKTGGWTDYCQQAYFYRKGFNEMQEEGMLGRLPLITEVALNDPYYQMRAHACILSAPSLTRPATTQGGGIHAAGSNTSHNPAAESESTTTADPSARQTESRADSKEGPTNRCSLADYRRQIKEGIKASGIGSGTLGQLTMGLLTLAFTVALWVLFYQDIITVIGLILQPWCLGTAAAALCIQRMLTEGRVPSYVEGFTELAAIWGELVHLPFSCLNLLATFLSPWWEPERIWPRTIQLSPFKLRWKRHARRGRLAETARQQEQTSRIERAASGKTPYKERSGWRQTGVATLLLLLITVLAGCTTTQAMHNLGAHPSNGRVPDTHQPLLPDSIGWRHSQQVQQVQLGNAHLVQQLSRLDAGCFRGCSGKLRGSS
jgi:hypothetical protein